MEGTGWPGPTYRVWPSWKPLARVQPSTDEPDTGTPSTAGWPLPDHSATPVPEPPAVSTRTSAKEAELPPSAETCPAIAPRTRSAPRPDTPRQACSAATRAGEPGASTQSRPPPRRATTASPGRTSQRSGMRASLVTARRTARSGATATPVAGPPGGAATGVTGVLPSGSSSGAADEPQLGGVGQVLGVRQDPHGVAEGAGALQRHGG